MTFSRTQCRETVREIVTHPDLYDRITDDNALPREECWPTIHPDLCYLLCHDAGQLVGMWLFSPITSTTWDTHTYLLPGHGFRQGRTAARECMAYLWEKTKVQRIVTGVPVFNRAAMLFARAAGMQPYGRNEQAFLKGGVYHDVVLLGVTRPKMG